MGGHYLQFCIRQQNVFDWPSSQCRPPSSSTPELRKGSLLSNRACALHAKGLRYNPRYLQVRLVEVPASNPEETLPTAVDNIEQDVLVVWINKRQLWTLCSSMEVPSSELKHEQLYVHRLICMIRRPVWFPGVPNQLQDGNCVHKAVHAQAFHGMHRVKQGC